MKLQHNQKGSSLVITMMLIGVVFILLVGFQAAILSLVTRINGTYSEKQSYLTARSVATALAEEIAAESAAEYTALLADASKEIKPENLLLVALADLTTVGDSITLQDIDFSSEVFMDAETEATITKTATGTNAEGATTATYLVEATATVNGDTDTVRLEVTATEQTITRSSGSDDSLATTEVVGEMPGFYIDKSGSIAKDLYIEASNYYPDIVFAEGLNDKGIYTFTLNGNTYVVGDAYLSNGSKFNWGSFFATGNITFENVVLDTNSDGAAMYAQGDVTLTGTTSVKVPITCDTLYLESGGTYALYGTVYANEIVVGDNATVLFYEGAVAVTEDGTATVNGETVNTLGGQPISSYDGTREIVFTVPDRMRPAWVDAAIAAETAGTALTLTAGTVNSLSTVDYAVSKETQTITLNWNYLGGNSCCIVVKANTTLNVYLGSVQGTSGWYFYLEDGATLNILDYGNARVYAQADSSATVYMATSTVATWSSITVPYITGSGTLLLRPDPIEGGTDGTASGNAGLAPETGESGVYTTYQIEQYVEG